MSNAANTAGITVTRARMFSRGKSGALCRTDRGVRTYHVGFELSDGSLLVQRRSFPSRWLAVYDLQRLSANLGTHIRRDLAAWDSDELRMYARE